MKAPSSLQQPFTFQGETSFPYLSGYTWVSFAHWKMLNSDYGNGPVRFNAESVQSGETIFVDYNCLGDFASRFLPRIQGKVILITANYGYGADHPMPGPFDFLLCDPKVIAWFVQNIDRNPSEKLFPIPIGLANKNWEHGNTHLLDQFIPQSLAKKTKSILCYLNYVPLLNRRACTNHFQTLGFPLAKRKAYADYLADLSETLFVVSPRGNGVDCHRTWEALLMGCYPIVQNSKLNPLYEGLPVVMIDDWSEVTEAFLHKKHAELSRQTWSRDKLYAPYWFEKVKKLV